MTASRRWVALRAPARVCAGSHGPDDRAMCVLFSQSSARSDWLLVTLSSLRNLAPPPPGSSSSESLFINFRQFEQSDRNSVLCYNSLLVFDTVIKFCAFNVN